MMSVHAFTGVSMLDHSAATIGYALPCMCAIACPGQGSLAKAFRRNSPLRSSPAEGTHGLAKCDGLAFVQLIFDLCNRFHPGDVPLLIMFLAQSAD